RGTWCYGTDETAARPRPQAFRVGRSPEPALACGELSPQPADRLLFGRSAALLLPRYSGHRGDTHFELENLQLAYRLIPGISVGLRGICRNRGKYCRLLPGRGLRGCGPGNSARQPDPGAVVQDDTLHRHVRGPVV